ncbi:hypothetical protein FHG87_014784 [Trinorchestia longiramus]|nr:hypothetical protein FHG87_014784 [Trinorchestia longiramus]
MATASGNTHSTPNQQFRLPAFSSEEPQMWFTQAEISFRQLGITNEETKFCCVSTALPPKVAVLVDQFITNPQGTEPYTVLKKNLLTKLQLSASKRIQSLVDQSRMPCASSSFLPSMVLSHIRKVAAGVGLSDVLLQEYFTSRLPSHVQPFTVKFPDDKPLDELAALADKLFELSPEPPQGNIAILVPITPAPVTQVFPVVANPAVSAHSDQSLREEIRSLALAFAELKADVKSERSSRSDTVSAIQTPQSLPVPHYVEGGVHYIQPGARYVEPQDQYQRQNVRYVQPESGYIQPEIGYAQPEFIYSRQSRYNQMINRARNYSPATQQYVRSQSFNRAHSPARSQSRPNTGLFEQPIIGVDFLSNFGLSVDLKNKLIRDETTSLSTPLSPVNITHSLHSIGAALDSKCKFQQILANYPALTKPNLAAKQNQSSTKHHIITTGPPVSSRARRLPPNRFEAAKAEFQRMQNARTVRISKSPWASSLMMVPKRNGEYRLCGDYRRLNAITIPDRFPIPHLQDFSANLHGATIFSKIDLAHAFHQIPMDEESIQKTAPALTRPYEGPFLVISRAAKYFIIEKHGKQDSVSVDRLKAAFVSDALIPNNLPPPDVTDLSVDDKSLLKPPVHRLEFGSQLAASLPSSIPCNPLLISGRSLDTHSCHSNTPVVISRQPVSTNATPITHLSKLNLQTRTVILPKPVQVSDRPPDRSTRSGRKILTLDHILDHSPDHSPDHIHDHIHDHILDNIFDHILDHYF